MILVRTTMIVAVAALVLAVAIPVPADDNGEEDLLKTEWLNYLGTNLAIPDLLVGGNIYLPPGGCDDAGEFGVTFCETLRPWDQEDENATYPDRIYINVRDDLGPRVGFYYEFINATSGDVLWDGFGCGGVNDLVPHTGQGNFEGDVFDQNATHLVVIPDALQSALLCGSPTITTGTVTVVWRYNAPVFQGEEFAGYEE